MASFRTKVPLPSKGLLLNHQSPLLALGSCFAQHIGQKLQDRKFSIVNNPFGILYNPISLAQSLLHIINAKNYQASDLFFHQELWHSFDHHGQFSNPSASAALESINQSTKEARAQINSSGVLLITLGTAMVFEHLESGRVVANCHKVAAKNFKHYRLSIDQVVAGFTPVLKQLQSQAPGLQCILTVSPVRHLKDGLTGNQKSKATLLLAAEQLCHQFDWIHYFPAYEIQMDDLRDYRFYDPDMIHPNSQAIDYIWSKFSESYFSEETLALNKDIEKIIRASQHRPFHPELKGHQDFIRQQLQKIEALEKKYSFLDFEAERIRFLN